MIRRLLGRIVRRCARAIISILPGRLVTRLLRPDHRDYRQAWVGAAGLPYRMHIYRRQHASATRPPNDNPTIEEIAAVLRADGAHSVLDAGCGWGRLAVGLGKEFDITGCDVSEDMLRLCPPGLKTFHLDLAIEDMPFLRSNTARWDAAFTRRVLRYINEPEACMYLLNNLLAVTRGKVHCWESIEDCERASSLYRGERLVLHPIEYREDE